MQIEVSNNWIAFRSEIVVKRTSAEDSAY